MYASILAQHLKHTTELACAAVTRISADLQQPAHIRGEVVTLKIFLNDGPLHVGDVASMRVDLILDTLSLRTLRDLAVRKLGDLIGQ